MAIIDVINMEGIKVKEIELKDEIFNSEVHMPLIHEMIRWYMANRRSGTASTKTRAYVSGGGRKPHPQKRTGRARQGSTRSPHFKGGGVVFGPHPRDYSFQIPKKKRKKALISALSYKLKEGLIGVFDEINVSAPKTKTFNEFLKKNGIEKSLFVVEKVDTNLSLATRNIPDIKVLDAFHLNIYDLLYYEKVYFTLDSIDDIYKRLE